VKRIYPRRWVVAGEGVIGGQHSPLRRRRAVRAWNRGRYPGLHPAERPGIPLSPEHARHLDDWHLVSRPW